MLTFSFKPVNNDLVKCANVFITDVAVMKVTTGKLAEWSVKRYDSGDSRTLSVDLV